MERVEGGESGGRRGWREGEPALGTHSRTETRVEAESGGLELSSLTNHRQELLHAGVDTRRANKREEEPIFIFTFSTYQSGTYQLYQSGTTGPLSLFTFAVFSYFFF